MRNSLLALPLIALLAAACGGQAPAMPEESTLALQSPDDSDSGSTSQPLCATGEEPEKAFLKREIDEMNDAVDKYRELYRAAMRLEARARSNGQFERSYSGLKGTLNVISEELADGSVSFEVSAEAKGEDAQARLLLKGTVSADSLSGTWQIFGRDGLVARTITWSKTQAGDLTAHWKNEKNGKSADYQRLGKERIFKLTNASGAAIEFQWNVETKVGSAAHLNSSGAISAKICWDAAFCTTACGQ